MDSLLVEFLSVLVFNLFDSAVDVFGLGECTVEGKRLVGWGNRAVEPEEDEEAAVTPPSRSRLLDLDGFTEA